MCKLNSAPGVRPGENQDLLTFDFQTLVTHNRTIICGSLREGLTYSSCAQHAEADCHKNDCVGRGVREKSESLHSFTFLVTVRVRFSPIDFNFSPLIYSKIVFCKSCDRSNLLNLKHQITSKCLSTRTFFTSSHSTTYNPLRDPNASRRVSPAHSDPPCAVSAHLETLDNFDIFPNMETYTCPKNECTIVQTTFCVDDFLTKKDKRG